MLIPSIVAIDGYVGILEGRELVLGDIGLELEGIDWRSNKDEDEEEGCAWVEIYCVEVDEKNN